LQGEKIPGWIKVPYTLFVLFLVPVYWGWYGPVNFLWFSNIALLTMTVALWWESRLLTSMMAVAVFILELGWNIAFFGTLLTGHEMLGLTGYMFDEAVPRLVRGLSLYHVVLPWLLVWVVCRLGYDQRALRWQTLVAWVVLPVTYVFASPTRNINWVYGWQESPFGWFSPPVQLVLLMVLIPAAIYYPTHLLLSRFFGGKWERR
jgi:hypothetical protein